MTSTRLTTKTITQTAGPDIHIETGELADQADGAVLIKSGNARLLATAVERKEQEVLNFLPLSVDYQEKFYAAGKIPGGFLKREGKATDQEILIARLVDRSIRPCFPANYHHAVQITIWLLSADEKVAPATLATIAASACLTISPIPFQQPISGVRVVRTKGKLQVNPSTIDLSSVDIDLMVSGKEDGIIMLEGKMHEVSTQDLLSAVDCAHEAIKQHCASQQELFLELSVVKEPTQAVPLEPSLEHKLYNVFYQPFYQICKQGITNKGVRNKAFDKIKQDYLATLQDEDNDLLNHYIEKYKKQAIRDLLLHEGLRIDGRKPKDIRNLHIVVDYLPSPHGSALFTRGETQSLTTVTLGGKLDEQLLDGATLSGYNKTMLHYNFPGFATNEIKPARGPARREIGHASLALNGLKAVLPQDYPYTLRIVSEILSSNGSSSMATATAASLALADAGVPIKRHIAGIAMGRISSQNQKPITLSDISGDEDFAGDMDFKATGTEKGFTACQLDIKQITLNISDIEEILQQAQPGIQHILAKMQQIIPTPRTTHKLHAPSMHTLNIELSTIGALIGPGGKVIKEIQQSTGANIDISEKNRHALVTIFAPDRDATQAALKRVKAITAVPTVGDIYLGKIKSIKDFGIFVEFLPGKDGLLHISLFY